MRQVLDQMTPLLRVTVAAMRAAKQELDESRSTLREPLAELLAVMQQHDLLDDATLGRSDSPAASARTDAPPKRRRFRKPASGNSQ
jgi:hypothetical protein